MYMKKWFFIVFVLPGTISCFSQIHSNTIFQLENIPKGGVMLDDHLQIFDDSSLAVSIDDLTTIQNNIVFKTNSGVHPFSNATRLVRWGRLILRNENNISGPFFFEFFRYDTIEVYFPDVEGYKRNLAGYSVGKSNLAVADNP